MSRIISLEKIKRLFDELITKGTTVIAPVARGEGRIFFEAITKSHDVVLDGSSSRSINSIKEFFFPRHEEICRFVRDKNDVILHDSLPEVKEQVLFGARPCDAASLPILDPLFAWGEQDLFYQTRREHTTVVTVACQQRDAHCFCEQVGGAPDNESGSDAILFDLGDGSYEVRFLTEKGYRLFEEQTENSERVGSAVEVPESESWSLEKIAQWIRDHYDSTIWSEMSRRCVGCGACTYLCPTCHCFDIIDEGSFQKGSRVKNWDSCQMALFSLHASGHNPRANQGQRQRQRVAHKFSIYPEKFGVLLCTGCGNCTRHCPAALGIRPLVERIQKECTNE